MPVQGVASNVLVDQRPIMASAVAAALAGKGRIFLQCVTELTGQTSPLDLIYDAANAVVSSGQSNGYRVAGSPHPVVEPGDYTYVHMPWGEFGLVVTLDRLDPRNAQLSMVDFEMKGTRAAAVETALAMERKLASILNSATNPWDAAVHSISTAFSDTTNSDPLSEYETALLAWQGSTTTIFEEPNVLQMSKKTRYLLKRNKTLVSQHGGNQGTDPLTDDQLLAAFAEYGIEEIVVGATGLYGARMNAFYRGNADAETEPGGIIWGHMGEAVGVPGEMDVEKMEQIGEVTVQQYHQTFEFNCASKGGLATVGPHGFQLNGAY